MSAIDSSLQAGIQALKANQVQEATRLLEHYCKLDTDDLSVYRLQAQMYLVRAYRKAGQQQAAIALCRQLVGSEHVKVSTWARQTLPKLITMSVPQTATDKPKAQPVINSNQAAVLGSLGHTRHHSPHPTQAAGQSVAQQHEIQLKSVTTFKRHYDQELLAELQELEQERKKLLVRGLITLPFFGLFLIALPFLWFIAMLGILGLGIYVSTLYQTYRKTFKEKIIRKILKFIDPSGNLSYSHYPAKHSTLNSHVREVMEALSEGTKNPQAPGEPRNLFSDILKISRPTVAQLETNEFLKNIVSSHRYSSRTSRQTRRSFIDSKLFGNKVPDNLSEEDCVEGRWGETWLYFSEVKAEDKNSDDEYRVYFQGLFFQANFNKSFKGRTVVVPDIAEKTFGAIGRFFQSWNKQHADELIKLEDPEFERLFAVYGTDQIEARYILSTSMMQRLVDLRKNVQREIRVSFVDNDVYIAISSNNKNLFEPRFFRSVIDFRSVLEYFETLQMMIGIVEDLKLNRRIWK